MFNSHKSPMFVSSHVFGLLPVSVYKSGNTFYLYLDNATTAAATICKGRLALTAFPYMCHKQTTAIIKWFVQIAEN